MVKKEKFSMIGAPFLKLMHPITKIPRTFGQKASDKLTKWAGSWTFIIFFLVFLAFWIFLNAVLWFKYNLSGDPIDPFPFILLNLVLSMIAALQAPIILMSQNREAQKDRLRAQYDYAVNRKAEKEIQEIKSQLDKIERKLSRRK